MPQLKIYEAKEMRDSWIPRGARELFDLTRHQQGQWFVVAHTAAEAVEIAQTAEISYADSPRKLRVGGHGTRLRSLINYGFLNVPGEVVVLSHSASGPVARFLSGTWSLIGRFEYDHATRDNIFVPEEG